MAQEEAVEPTNIFTFKDEKPALDPVYEYPATLHQLHVPLVIDNGSYQCRAGWATSDTPQLIFKNITAKQRGKKETDLQVGNEINNIEVVRWILRTQFDKNVVTLYDVQEQIYDYIFGHLGVSTEGCVEHPIVLTEPVCNPNYCRQQMSELLFECYHVPQVAYGVDALFSLQANHPHPDTANSVVVSCGYQTTHILPVVNGRLDAEHCRRINIGGCHLDGFMQRLLQLKYPGHMASITVSRAEELIRDHTYMAVDYLLELEDWTDHDFYDDNVHKIQLPFTNVASNVLSAEQQRERREQQIKRLKDVNAKRRMEKLAIEEEKLQQLMSVQELLEDEDEDAFTRALSSCGYSTAEELQAAINKLTVAIQRGKAKILGVEPPPEEQETKAPMFDLLDVPDELLTPDQLVTKKRQRILKSAREGRARAQALQTAKRQKELEEEKKLEQKRLLNFHGWLQEVRHKRQQLLEGRMTRKQKKTDMAKRRTLASQQRMKIISQLAANTSKKEDTFGQNDADWEVYKEINPDDSDSEAEDEEIEELETLLREHDPEFQKDLDDGAPASQFDVAEYYRLHLAVERTRVPELLFQPSMIGLEQAGVAETMEFVLKKYNTPSPVSQANHNNMVKYVFLTGGNAMFPRFEDRLERELLAMRPFQSTFGVYTAANPALDAWRGARRMALSPQLAMCSITKAEYEELGGEYLKEHGASNRYIPTPVLVPK